MTQLRQPSIDFEIDTSSYVSSASLRSSASKKSSLPSMESIVLFFARVFLARSIRFTKS